MKEIRTTVALLTVFALPFINWHFKLMPRQDASLTTVSQDDCVAVPGRECTAPEDVFTTSITDWFTHKPYDTPEEFVAYWKKAALHFEQVHKVPHQLILAKLWLETEGGRTGAGRRGALFGIKGKGNKGYDNVDKERVEYAGYDQRWEALSHFCNLVKKPMYRSRFENWKKYGPQKPDWYNYALALQVDYHLRNSSYAYAACGCKSGTNRECYDKRKKHAAKVIDFVKNYIN